MKLNEWGRQKVSSLGGCRSADSRRSMQRGIVTKSMLKKKEPLEAHGRPPVGGGGGGGGSYYVPEVRERTVEPASLNGQRMAS